MLGGIRRTNKIIQLAIYCQQIRATCPTIVLFDCSCLKRREVSLPGKYRKHSEARGVAAWLLLETCAATLSELSSFTGREKSTLSSAAKAVQTRSKADHLLADCMAELKALFFINLHNSSLPPIAPLVRGTGIGRSKRRPYVFRY